jgi:penicillin-binding protein 1A
MPRRSRKAKIRWKPASAKPRRRRSWLWRLVNWSLVAGVWGAVALALAVGWYAYDLPEVTSIAKTGRQPSITVIAADGSQVAAVGDVRGKTIGLKQVPPALRQALIAVEDRRFYDHFGVDPRGLARAMLANLRAGRIVQGGSTITQQLAKNLFLNPDRTIRRKVQELLLAFWLERKFSKDQILTLYLNRVYFGAGNYGVDAAARRYFGKPVQDLSLYESALLAGLLKAPSRYNPARNAGGADLRTQLVLGAMVDAGFISAAEAARALRNKSRSRVLAVGQGRYFIDWVLNQVADYVGQTGRDLIVVTTLDSGLQQIAETELVGLLDGPGSELGAGQAAFVALTPGGAVRAMVGGRNYGESQFNRAVQALRQPGSAFKVFTYLAAFEKGLDPDDPFVDSPVEVDGWAPRNYNERYFGRVTLREAFARSLNSVAVRVLQEVGPETVAATARRLGVTSELEATPSIALGTSEVTLLELTGAYAVFANRGAGVWPYAIEEIREASGRVLYRRSGDGPGRVVAPGAVDQMADVMTATVEWGSGKAARQTRPAAGKTGTSQDFRDAWFVGYTAELVAGVWFGNDDGAPMKNVTGGSLPARLWGRVLARGLAGVPASPLPGGDVVVAETEGGFIARILRSLGGGGAQEPEPPSWRVRDDQDRGR